MNAVVAAIAGAIALVLVFVVPDWHYASIENIHLAWVVIAVAGALLAFEVASRDALSMFLSPVMQPRLTERAGTARIAGRLGLVFLALLAGVGALMRPQATGEAQTVTTVRSTADIMFVLDTSRSMLAEDAAPTRLDRAKADIVKMVDLLDGQRVGLVAFAGRASQMCPLTPDHSFFRTALSTVDTRSAGRGGTKLGEAIKVAVRGFPTSPGAKLIVLITDGDDQDPYSEEAAKAARDAGIKIVTVGFGSEQGSTITLIDPITKARTTLMHDGKPVISKLNAEQLRKIALVTEGVYIPAGTSAIDLEDIVSSHVQPMMRAAEADAMRVIPSEKFQVFVFFALLFLFAALATGSGTDAATGLTTGSRRGAA